MKKVFKNLICSVLALILIVSCFVFSASAASTSISLSSTSPTVGGKLTVTVTVSGDEKMYGVTFLVNYNPDVLRFDTGTDASGGAGVVTVVGMPSGLTKTSYVLTFTTIASGSSSISVSSCSYVGYDDAAREIGGSSVNITVKDATKSGDANLRSLRLGAGTISPAFSKDVTYYTATIPYSVTECKVYTRTSDPDAQVGVEGSATMKVGENTRTVVVTAPNGTQKRYKIVITRLAEGESEEPEEPGESATTVAISGTNYQILEDLTGITVPKGFLIASADYNGVQVATLEDENGKYLIYYLKNAEDNKSEPFIIDEDTKSFKKLPYITSGNDFYILEDVDDTKGVPVGAQISSVNINGSFVSGFIPENDNMVGFYYVTCYINGVSSFYRYDSEMGTLQRELGLVFGENAMVYDVEESGDSFFARFANLNTAAKFVVIAIVLIILIIIALIVLVIVQAIKSRKRDGAFVDEEAGTETPDGFVFAPEEIPAQPNIEMPEEEIFPEEEAELKEEKVSEENSETEEVSEETEVEEETEE